MAALARREPGRARRIPAAVGRYATTGHGDVIRLQGRPQHRLRVGDWRVIFEFDAANRSVVLLMVGPRSDIYRR